MFDLVLFGTVFVLIGIYAFYAYIQFKKQNKDQVITEKKVAIKANSISVEDFLFFKDIFKDMVVLKNNEYRAVVEISPLNYAMLSEEEQMSVDSILATFYRTIDYPLQDISQCRNLNLANYYNWIRTESDKTCQELLRVGEEAQAQSISNYFEYYLTALDEEIRMVKSPERRYLHVIPAHASNPDEAQQIIRDRYMNMRNLLGGRIHLRMLSSSEIADVFFTSTNKRRSGDSRIKDDDYFAPYIQGQYDLVGEEDRGNALKGEIYSAF